MIVQFSAVFCLSLQYLSFVEKCKEEEEDDDNDCGPVGCSLSMYKSCSLRSNGVNETTQKGESKTYKKLNTEEKIDIDR